MMLTEYSMPYTSGLYFYSTGLILILKTNPILLAYTSIREAQFSNLYLCNEGPIVQAYTSLNRPL